MPSNPGQLERGEEDPMATAAVETKAPASRLGKAQRGKLKIPPRCVFYGPEGVGKSTLAAHAPAPIWFDVEDGSGRLDVARYMFRDEPGGHMPKAYADILAGIEDLTRNPHEFKTLVIDTADRVESLLWRHIIDRDKAKAKGGLENIEDYGYGKGYQVAVDEWRALCARLDTLRISRGVMVVLLAHAHVKTFKSPDSDDYERYNLQLNDKAAGFIKGWSDIVGFCRFDEWGGKAPGAARAKGASTGKRLLNLVRTAAYDAKGRGGMPAELELDVVNPWAPLQKAMDDADNLGAPEMAALIAAETARIGDAELTAKVAAAVTTAVEKKDTETLNRYLQDLKRREAKGAVTQ